MNREFQRSFAIARCLTRILLVACVAGLGSCRFLADEFSWIDRAGPVVEQEQLVPSPTDDRP